MEGVWRCMVEWANLGRGRTELVRKCTDRTDPYGPSRPKSCGSPRQAGYSWKGRARLDYVSGQRRGQIHEPMRSISSQGFHLTNQAKKWRSKSDELSWCLCKDTARSSEIVYGQGLAILVPRRLVQEKNTSGSKEDGVKSLAPSGDEERRGL
ncbi:hypothetical protein YC2023_072071 [Brassica napus]